MALWRRKKRGRKLTVKEKKVKKQNKLDAEGVLDEEERSRRQTLKTSEFEHLPSQLVYSLRRPLSSRRLWPKKYLILGLGLPSMMRLPTTSSINFNSLAYIPTQDQLRVRAFPSTPMLLPHPLRSATWLSAC